MGVHISFKRFYAKRLPLSFVICSQTSTTRKRIRIEKFLPGLLCKTVLVLGTCHKQGSMNERCIFLPCFAALCFKERFHMPSSTLYNHATTKLAISSYGMSQIRCQKHKIGSLLLSSRYKKSYIKSYSFLLAYFIGTLKICQEKLMVKHLIIGKTYIADTHWNCLL